MAFNDLCSRTQVFNAPIGARSQENCVDLDVAHGSTSFEPHVIQSLLRCGSLDFVLKVIRVGNAARERDTLSGVCPPGNEGLQVLSIQDHFSVKDRIFI